MIPYVFEGVCDASHAEDGDPDGADRAQEVTVLQRIVVHYAHDCDPGLIARVVELQKTRIKRKRNEPESPGKRQTPPAGHVTGPCELPWKRTL